MLQETQTSRRAGECSTASLNGIATASQLAQIRVREIMKGLELERANHSATPSGVERRDESKGKNRCGRGQTKHSDDAIDSLALTGGDITRYRFKFASMRVCCAMAKPSMRDMECVKRIGRYLVGKPRAKCWFLCPRSGDLEASEPLDGRSQLESS